MPNIPTYNAPEPDIRVTTEQASEAFRTAGRTIGELGREGAQQTERGIKEIGAGIADFGQKLQEHQDYQDEINGIHTFSNLQLQQDKETRDLLNDPTIPPDQLQSRLNQLYDQHARAVDQFENSLSGASDKVKEKFASITGDYRKSLSLKFEADQSNAAGLLEGSTVTKTLNNAFADLGPNPTTLDINQRIQMVQALKDSILGNNRMSLERRTEINKQIDAGVSQFVGGAIQQKITNDPTQTEPLLSQYGQYLSPGEAERLRTHQDEVTRRGQSEAAMAGANNIVNQFLGTNTTSAPAPGFDGLWGRIKSSEGGLDSSGQPLTSPKGAIGVSQILPDTARMVAGEMGVQFDPQRLYTDQGYNEMLGKRYLQDMLDRYGGNSTLAAAAYNAGPQRVDSWLQSIGDPRTGQISDRQFASRIPIMETRNYTLGILDKGAGQPTTLASTAPRFPSPVPPAQRAGSLAVGDSITQGLITGAGFEGTPTNHRGGTPLGQFDRGATTSVGAQPQAILDQINQLPPETFKGRTVVLSTGASNNPDQVADIVPQEINALKAKGAAGVTVVGVGTNDKLAGLNDKLAQIAKENGATFAGPIQGVGSDGIHPARYQDFAHTLPAAQPFEGAQVTPVSATTAARPATPGALRPFPSKEDMYKQIPPGLSPREQHVYEEVIDKAHDKLRTMTEDERYQISTEITGGIEKLEQGQDYDYDPNVIRHYFEPKQAEKLIANLDDAKAIGTQIHAIRGLPIAEAESTLQQLRATQKDVDPAIYEIHAKMVVAYQHALAQHLHALLGVRLDQNGDVIPGETQQADPAQYLITTDPRLHDLYNGLHLDDPAKALGDPQAVGNYVNGMISRQAELGVPADKQHVLPQGLAQGMAQQILQNPAQALDMMKHWQDTYGAGYQHVFYDLVTLGKLPATYQLMGALEPADAQMFARAVTEQTTANLKDTGKETYWADKLGHPPGAPSNYEDIKSKVENDPKVGQFLQSMRNANASGQQISSLLDAMQTMAFARKAYAGDDNDSAVSNAVQAALGHFEFYDGARIPTAKFDTAITLANQTVNKLTPDSIQLPRDVGGTGQATADQYLALVKHSPTWWTTPDQRGMVLVDPRGMVVRDKTGTPIKINFNDVPEPQPPVETTVVAPPF